MDYKKSDILDLFNKGWCIHERGIREIKDAPFSKETIKGLIDKTNGKITHIAFMFNLETHEKLTYIIDNKELLNIAYQVLNEQSKTLGFNMRVVCEVRSTDEGIRISDTMKFVNEVTGYKVTAGETDKQFYVFYSYEGETKDLGQDVLLKLDRVLLALSLKNRVGFSIIGTSWGEYSKARPVVGWSGAWTNTCEKAGKDDFSLVDIALKTEEANELLLKIRSFYAHSSKKDQVIYGSALVEKLFSKSHECLLDEKEKEKLFEKISVGVFLSDQEKKIREIKQAFNSDRLPKTTKNERVVENVLKFFNASKEDILIKLRKLSKVRQKIAHHADDVASSEMMEPLKFVEELLFSYLHYLNRDLS